MVSGMGSGNLLEAFGAKTSCNEDNSGAILHQVGHEGEDINILMKAMEHGAGRESNEHDVDFTDEQERKAGSSSVDEQTVAVEDGADARGEEGRCQGEHDDQGEQ